MMVSEPSNIDYTTWKPARDELVPMQFLMRAETDPNRAAYHVRGPETWETTNWGDYVAETKRAARALIALGVEEGQNVGIISFNRPEWIVGAMACMLTRAAPAGIYTTSAADEVEYILNHTEAPVVLIEDEEQYQKIAQKKNQLTHLKHIVLMRGAPAIDDPMVLSFDAFLQKGDDVEEAKLNERIDRITSDDLASLIYTSGTTGRPKGVMLSHESVTWAYRALSASIDSTPDDTVLSYLPLSHIAEQTTTIYGPPLTGSSVHFAQSMDTIREDLAEARPHVFFGVPRVWERMYGVLHERISTATGVKGSLARWAMDVGNKYHAATLGGGSANPLLALQHKLANKLIYSKVKAALGFDRAHILISGAAPISPEILKFFFSLDIQVREVYGQSEDCGPTSINLHGRTRIGSVGPPLDGLDVKIAEDGEILVAGTSVFTGYYKNEEATTETMDGDYLLTGDLGHIDDDGYLWITGRKKDIIITAGGKNIAPRPVEDEMEQHPFVEQAMMIGDKQKFCAALVTPCLEKIEAFAAENGIDKEGAQHHEKVLAAIQSHIDDINSRHARVSHVRKFTMMNELFSLENGELTPTLKLKRNVVREKHAATINAIYAD